MNVVLLIVIILLSTTEAFSASAVANYAFRVNWSLGSACSALREPYPGSTECLIGCLSDKTSLLVFGWNWNTSECRCCRHQYTQSTEVDGLHWETYLPGCSGGFNPVLHNERSLCLLYESQAKNLSFAKADCEMRGANLVDPTNEFAKVQILIRLTGKNPLNIWHINSDETHELRPYVCEKDGIFQEFDTTKN